MHGQLKIAFEEVLKGALQQLLLEAGPFESFSKKGFGSIICATSSHYPAIGTIFNLQKNIYKLYKTRVFSVKVQ